VAEAIKPEDYERRISQLENQVEELKTVVDMLRYCKQSSRYTYYNWLIEQNVSDQDRTRIEAILHVFSYRFEGEEIPNHLRRTIAGFDLTEICKDTMPHYEELADTLIQAIEWFDDTHVRALLKAMYQQMMMKDLYKHFLDEVGEDPNGEMYPDE
jgi:hypothetical protein